MKRNELAKPDIAKRRTSRSTHRLNADPFAALRTSFGLQASDGFLGCAQFIQVAKSKI
jgi:hypothetical protein